MDSRVDPEQDFVAWNEAMVKRYDIEQYYDRSHPIVRRIEAARIAAIVRLAGARPGERVLEVGCGAGHVLHRFAQCRRTGVDLSPLMLARARHRLGNDVQLVRGAAEHLPFAAGSFDIVVCTEVLEHTRQPERVIRELMRMVNQQGRVLVSVPNEGNIDRAKRVLRRTPVLRHVLRSLAGEGNEWHLHRFDLKLLRRVVAGAARIDRLVTIPFRPLAVRYVARLEPNGASKPPQVASRGQA